MLYSCLNVKELLSWSRCYIWRLGDCNQTRTHNKLVRKRTLNHLDKRIFNHLCVRLRTKWLWLQVSLQSLSVFTAQNRTTENYHHTQHVKISSPKSVFLVLNRKSRHHDQIQHIQISLDAKFHLKETLKAYFY